jgi:hypothetical protein
MFECMMTFSANKPCEDTNKILDEFIDDYNITSKGESLGDGASVDTDTREVLRESAYDVAKKALGTIGLEEGGDNRKKPDVKFFLNRIAGLPVPHQNLLFKLFAATLSDVVAAAKKNGWYEGCVEDLIAKSVTEEFSKVIAIDDKRGGSSAKTMFTSLILDRGWSLEGLIREEKETFEGDGVAGLGLGGGDDDDAEMDDFIVDDDDVEEERGEGGGRGGRRGRRSGSPASTPPAASRWTGRTASST